MKTQIFKITHYLNHTKKSFSLQHLLFTFTFFITSPGTWQLSKGYKYVGGFAGQKPCGDGKWCFQGFDVVGSYSQETKPVDSSDNNAVETKIYWETAAIVENNMPN